MDTTGGTPAFSDITGATNSTGNAMIVGSTSSLTATGSGIIDATEGDTATAFFDAGEIEVARGGSGLATLATGSLLTGAVAADMVPLAAVALGSVLVSGCASTIPAWSSTPDLGVPTAIDISAATGSINLGAGTIEGSVNTIIETTGATDSLSATEVAGSFLIAAYTTGPMVYDLPTAVVGENACFYDREGDGITIVPNTSDRFILDGVDLTAPFTIDSPAVVGGAGTGKGDFICILAIDAEFWMTVGRSGAWVDGGAE
jgi:hypothetical protein